MEPSLPSADLLKLQSDWLADARSRLLRNAEIAKRKRVLDLGSGYGFVIPELRRRCSGRIVGLDRSLQALSTYIANIPVVCAEAARLPFLNYTFDLIFSQNVMLWAKRTTEVVREVHRVLSHDGSWVMLEPDFGGLIEYPPEVETVDLWLTALHRAGADPFIGRKLPPMLNAAGYMVRVELLPRLFSSRSERFDFLEGLPLTEEEAKILGDIKTISDEINPAQQVAHLPYFLIIADRA
jgi:SAM-dependent methyltransferase